MSVTQTLYSDFDSIFKFALTKTYYAGMVSAYFFTAFCDVFTILLARRKKFSLLKLCFLVRVFELRHAFKAANAPLFEPLLQPMYLVERRRALRGLAAVFIADHILVKLHKVDATPKHPQYPLYTYYTFSVCKTEPHMCNGFGKHTKRLKDINTEWMLLGYYSHMTIRAAARLRGWSAVSGVEKNA